MKTLYRVGLSFLCFFGLSQGMEVDVNMDRCLATVEKEFLSVGIGRPWDSFNFSSPRMQTLMRGLSPAYLRHGGDLFVFSDQPARVFDRAGTSPSLRPFGTKNIDGMVHLVRSVGFKILLALNQQLRYGTQWNPTNSINLLAYLNEMKYHDVLNFELGNEPDLYHFVPSQVTLNGSQIGRDFVMLHKLLALYNFTKCTLVGPDSALIHHSQTGLFYQFVQVAGKFLTAATFHHYYFRGETANVSEFINATILDSYKNEISRAKEIIKTTKTPDLPVWLGEGADANEGGAANISDRYVAGFSWLDKLGVSAREGMGAVIRQTFYGGNYGLLSGKNPTPDYWLSFLHKQLAGQIVLNVTTAVQPDTTLYWESFWDWYSGSNSGLAAQEVRVYAHCTKPSSKYHKGSVTVFALNVKKSGYETLTFLAPLSGQTVHIYMLTPAEPGGLLAKQVALNGKTLELIDDHTLPQLVPVQQSASAGIKLAALTFGFFVFPDANAAVCK